MYKSLNSLLKISILNAQTESGVEVGSLLDELGLKEKQQFAFLHCLRQFPYRLGWLHHDSQHLGVFGREEFFLAVRTVLGGTLFRVPRMIPSNPLALLTSNILSTPSKLKILLEPFRRWDSKKSSMMKISDTDSTLVVLLKALNKTIDTRQEVGHERERELN
ncbi:hypothetical protein HPP92_019770 [Vanilla planifolia]|uniref:Uncharacterized protein n=1 Tax=Vanilla planifolia TaxID=51239 RepID=A0A835Q3H5_VANPL|nr:hypothetical protein HPP92_019770 [Vanilla planifolia]